ncbi:MAG: AlkZ family DNA glycosylase [Candidatus Dormibacteraeota bacterium]|uniref:AlkZ family DNA glycosylase n=1 Tax=Candidatus Nephthysia bennettiae TaxID=3127016 RepID=A0A934K1W9_9BACT|nr:AlkZ family DNA glycosylase [Candidatus Dormibacteraeota bacterium]MBJ7613339.1 AlkZ family DNA glycosylase [Candidatus Dormibacteraeota bacterium]
MTRLTPRALNRALLMRQGLLERLDLPLVEAVESIGALQAQHWPAVSVALWSRLHGVGAEELRQAFAEGRLVVGNLLRGTLHAVSGRQHAAYAVVVAESGMNDWRRTEAQRPLDLGAVRADLAAFAESTPRSADEMIDRIEAWVAGQFRLDEEELARQRAYRWRPLLAAMPFSKVPSDGRWAGGRTPGAFLASAALRGALPSPSEALDSVVRWHLAAFGPAAAEDVAAWIGWRTVPVRAALEGAGSELRRFQDEAGRTLFDVPSASRPDQELEAPVRLLPWFDSALLAYAPRHRGRILPDAYRDLVYMRANLQWLPTLLVDGMVAGTWSVDLRRSEASLTLKPFERLARPVRAALIDEAERLVRFMKPDAANHAVLFAGG